MSIGDVNLPEDSKLAGKMLEGHLHEERTKLERGKIGAWIGSGSAVPYNVAALISGMAAFVLILFIAFRSGDSSFTIKDGATLLWSMVSLPLGYLFGRVSK